MTRRATLTTAALSASWLAVALPASGQTAAASASRVAIVFDWRGRFESDVNSTREDGTPRQDRHRGRIRTRVEVRAKAGPSLFVIGRVRTGSPFSQQSPHLTVFDFSGGRADDLRAVADKYLVHYTAGRSSSGAVEASALGLGHSDRSK